MRALIAWCVHGGGVTPGSVFHLQKVLGHSILTTLGLPLTRALPKIPYPDHCRTSPDDNRDLSHWPAGEDRVQDEGNGDKRKRHRTDQRGCGPAQAREIEKPEEHRQAPVKRRFPGSVANHQRDDMAMGIE